MQKVARLLGQIDKPLDATTCRAISNFLDPGEGTQKTGPKTSICEKFQKHMNAACVYGVILQGLGLDGGPVNMTDAKLEACEILGCSMSSLTKTYIAPPMDRVVLWARDSVNPASEELKKLWADFKEKETGNN